MLHPTIDNAIVCDFYSGNKNQIILVYLFRTCDLNWQICINLNMDMQIVYNLIILILAYIMVGWGSENCHQDGHFGESYS